MRYSEHICARYQQALNLLSRRWVGLIVRVLLDGSLRFNELASKLQVVADRVLAERLRELEAEGIVTRAVHVGSPVRVEYGLTEKGLALAPVLDAIEAWSHEWIPLEDAADEIAQAGPDKSPGNVVEARAHAEHAPATLHRS
ncbi:MAG TPA: helix-turn-helix domain-containing protein [Ktedonobacterales bacterium]